MLTRIVKEAEEARARSGEVNTQAIIEDGFRAELRPLLLAERFARASTGLVIILGLLGTFYGLTLSIGKLVHLVSADPGAAADVTQTVTHGLSQALTGMAVAFSNSLVGILSAVVLTALGVVRLRTLDGEIQAGRSQLAVSQATLQQQQAVIVDTNRQLDSVRARLQDIAVLRLSVLTKLKQAIESQLAPGDAGGAAVTLDASGDISINESLVFEYDSYAIKKEGRALLDALATALGNVLAEADVRSNIDTIVIQGHTDERGSDALNWDLSARRATAVVEYLFQANRSLADSYARYFSASAYSKYRPVDPAATEAAYQRNRRIEISIVPRDDNVRKVIEEYVESARPSAPPTSGAP